jgi:hypothetical protein
MGKLLINNLSQRVAMTSYLGYYTKGPSYHKELAGVATNSEFFITVFVVEQGAAFL